MTPAPPGLPAARPDRDRAMRVKMLVCQASSLWTREAREEYEVDDDEGGRLIAAGIAVPAEKPAKPNRAGAAPKE